MRAGQLSGGDCFRKRLREGDGDQVTRNIGGKMEKSLIGHLVLSGAEAGLTLKDDKGNEIIFDGSIEHSITLQHDKLHIKSVLFKITNNE